MAEPRAMHDFPQVTDSRCWICIIPGWCPGVYCWTQSPSTGAAVQDLYLPGSCLGVNLIADNQISSSPPFACALQSKISLVMCVCGSHSLKVDAFPASTASEFLGASRSNSSPPAFP